MVETGSIKNHDAIELSNKSLLSRLPLLFVGLGLGAMIYWASLMQTEHARAMYGYLFGFIAVLSLALGCMVFILLQHITKAGWSVSIRRIAEVSISLMPLFIIFFIPIALSIHEIFPWTHAEHIDEILSKKLPYLNEKFFLARSFAYLLIWALIGVVFYRLSVAQDKGGGHEPTKTMQIISAPCIILFGLSLTFASFDWIMSLQPHWYSTIFGVYFFAGCLLFGLAFMTLISMLLQKNGYLKTSITKEHYHDLGKLMFGFTVFWAYIAFSQFMLYWYGNIPEEIEFYTHRLHHGWEIISWAMPVSHFFIPFLALMSRFLKRKKLVLAINCIWVILVHLVDLYWLIIPAYSDPKIGSGPEHLHLSLFDVLPLLGLGFIFLGAFFFVLGRKKILAVGDPRLPESLAFENF